MNGGTFNVFYLYVLDRITREIFGFCNCDIHFNDRLPITDYLLVTLDNCDNISIFSDIYIHILLL